MACGAQVMAKMFLHFRITEINRADGVIYAAPLENTGSRYLDTAIGIVRKVTNG